MKIEFPKSVSGAYFCSRHGSVAITSNLPCSNLIAIFHKPYGLDSELQTLDNIEDFYLSELS